jgi:outer membrane protein assembly factor BamB
VAVDAGKVFSGKSGGAVAAYDASTGKELWSTVIRTEGGSVDIQPVVVDGLVLAATSALRDPGARGTLYALDAETGEIVWSFDTIESEDLWGHPELNSGGGSWYPPAVDIEAGVSYWGTSNPYPFPGVEGFPNGSSRPGDNRWTDSLLAIDLQTGELRWGHQAIAHDLFDRDAVIAAIARLPNGEQVIINSGKLGRVIGLDPDGTLLWDTPVGMHKNDDLESFEGQLEVLPGSLGGVETPIAVADGVVYVTVVNAATTYSGPQQNSTGFGAALGSNDSQLVAIDATTGAILWDVAIPGDCFGAATVVNDLVFTSVLTGTIFAFNRITGEQVWSYQAPGGINGWPAFVDDRLVIPVGFGSPPVLLALALDSE